MKSIAKENMQINILLFHLDVTNYISRGAFNKFPDFLYKHLKLL